MIDLEDKLFHEYFKEWVHLYKEGLIAPVTLEKYVNAYKWIKRIAPDLHVSEINRITYQKLMNDYGKEHEKQTCADFHHIIKASVLDAVDDGLVERDPTRKVVIKGKPPREKKIKFLTQLELTKLVADLDLGNEVNWDWFILLLAKTGLRFAEGLGLQRKDFDFDNQQIEVNKTWAYKNGGGFAPTKNASSVRTIKIDWKLCVQMQQLIGEMDPDELVFVKPNKNIYNSTLNEILSRHCRNSGISEITVHGLRHTHASILMFEGISIASVAKRLGHANMATTQSTYLHIIQELEDKDTNKVMASMCAF